MYTQAIFANSVVDASEFYVKSWDHLKVENVETATSVKDANKWNQSGMVIVIIAEYVNRVMNSLLQLFMMDYV